MGNLFCQTSGSATNSGSTDTDAATLSGATATVVGSVVTLPAATDLTAVDATAGSATQSTIHLTDASNANTKIFWITAKADSGGATPNVTVSVAPTGVVSSNWAIGGRVVLTNASQEGAVRAGDTFWFNDSPAAAAATMWTFRNAGDSTSGFAKIRGKIGVRPVLNTTNTSNCVTMGQSLCWVENLEIDQDGASGTGINATAGGCLLYNVKVSDAGGNGIGGSTSLRVISCEITGVGADGINQAQANMLVHGCYIHDLVGDGIELTAVAPSATITNNIIDTPTARAIYLSGATSTVAGGVHIIGNTIFDSGNSGIEVLDADTIVSIISNVLQDCGDGAGEANVEWAAGTAELVSFHGWNTLYNNSGADAPIGFTANSQVSGTEFTTDPQFTSAAGANFAIPSTSPAYGTGMPLTWLGASTTSFISQGAMQLSGAGGSAGLLSSKPMAGNFQG